MPKKDKPLARGWDRAFHDPITLPDGGELRTLRDAGNYIASLPKAEHDAPEWITAIEALMLVVEHGGDVMLPRIGIMPALLSVRRVDAYAMNQGTRIGVCQME